MPSRTLHRRALDRHLEQASWRHERTLNAIRTLIWLAVGLALVAAGWSEGRNDPMGILSLFYAGVCTAFGVLVLRRVYRPWFPLATTLADVTVLLGSAGQLTQAHLARDPGSAQSLVNGVGLGLMAILVTHALRMDWRPVVVTGVYGVFGYIYVKSLVEPPSFFWLVTVVTIGSAVVVLALATIRARQIAEQLFGEVRELYDDRIRVMGRLVAGTAHELNNPVGTLQSSLHTLERAQAALSSDPAKADRIATAIDQASASALASIERITQTLDALKAFARPDEASLQDVDLGRGIIGTVRLLRAQADASLSIETDVDELPRIRGNPAQLNQVLFNLLRNAEEAMKGRGTIRVRAGLEGTDVVIRVEDDGPGIPAELIERIFEPGFRQHNGRVRMSLGLAVSRSVIQDHGGTLLLSSEIGRGTTVTISLPQLFSSQEQPQPTTDVPPSTTETPSALLG